MGVRINGVWHEELADPGTGGSDSGNGRSYDSAQKYDAAASGVKFSSNINHSTGTSPTGTNTTAAPEKPGASAMDAQINQLIQALNTTNEEDFQEKIRQYNLDHDLAVKEFEQKTLEFGKTLGFNYDQLAADMGFKYANLGETAREADQTAGIQAIQAIGQLNADPFKQQEIMYGLGRGGYSGVIDSIAGRAPVQAQTGALNGSAAATAAPSYYANKIAGYASGQPAPQAAQAPAGYADPNAGKYPTTGNPQVAQYLDPSHMAQFYAHAMTGGNAQQVMGAASDVATGAARSDPAMAAYYQAIDALPNPNQVVARSFVAADPGTQRFVLSGLKAKTGLDTDVIEHQIKAGLPQFKAPSFGSASI